MAAERISLTASSHLNSATSAQAQHSRAAQKSAQTEGAAARANAPAKTPNTAPNTASTNASTTQVTISQRAKDMAAQRQAGDARHESQRVQEQQAVQQMSLLNGELRRAYST